MRNKNQTGRKQPEETHQQPRNSKERPEENCCIQGRGRPRRTVASREEEGRGEQLHPGKRKAEENSCISIRGGGRTEEDCCNKGNGKTDIRKTGHVMKKKQGTLYEK